MPGTDIPDHFGSKTVAVKGSWLHYLEAGTGDPVLFLHGNPTWSYLWRNVIPHVEDKGRCIAVDLIGMGRSGKPDIAYRLVDHVAYLDAFIDALELRDLTLVMHDWGVAIGLHYAKRFPARVRALAFMEGHLRPIDRWERFDEGSRAMFKDLRTDGLGQRMVIEDNFFIETILPAGTQRTLSDREMNAYRAPYLEPRARKPLWRWPNEIPIEGTPADVVEIVNGNWHSLAAADLPKLLLYARPGAVIGTDAVSLCQETLSNLTAADVGDGLHFLPEDRPDEIGVALAHWLEAHT
ncbi:MAG: haloalkane dehalogenase [Deinococcota bacterium]|nr:haloalkane dehalogenase [Deinococcota bacterium]